MCQSANDIDRLKLGARRTITVAGSFNRERLGRYAVQASAASRYAGEVAGARNREQGFGLKLLDEPVIHSVLGDLHEDLASAVHVTLGALDRVQASDPRPHRQRPVRTLSQHELSERYLHGTKLPTWEATPAVLVKMGAPQDARRSPFKPVKVPVHPVV